MSSKIFVYGREVEVILEFYDKYQLSESTIKEVSKVALKAIYDELSEEARRIDVIKDVLKFAKESLETSIIKL